MTRNRAHKADRDVWTSGVLTKVLQAPSDQFSQKMISSLPPVPRTHDFSENVLLVAVPASSSSSAFVISRRSLVVFYLVEASWSLDPNKLMIQAAAVPLLLMSCNCNNCVMKIQTFQNYNENLAPSNAANCF